jgi:hypothetical protein
MGKMSQASAEEILTANGGLMRRGWLCALAMAAIAGCSGRSPGSSITQEELVRRSQEIFDSVAVGEPTPWRKYFADDCLFFDEKGRNMSKEALLKDVAPLPAGYSGNIKIVSPQSRILANTAILSYDLDETEVVFGQQLKARYHATDTWLLRNGSWQIVASQVLRYYEDPAAAKPDPSRYRDFVGTYELAPGNTMTISAEGEALYAQRSGRAKVVLLSESPDLFFRRGVEGRILFRRSNDGKVDNLVDRRNNEDVIWKRVS